MRRFSPVGFMRVSHTRLDVEFNAGPNPYLNPALKAHFLEHLASFQVYETFTLKPIQ